MPHGVAHMLHGAVHMPHGVAHMLHGVVHMPHGASLCEGGVE